MTSSRPGKSCSVSSVAAILSGLWAKSSMTVTPPALPTTSSRRWMPVKPPSAAAAAARPTPQASRRGQRRQRVGDVVQPGDLQRRRCAVSPLRPRGDVEADAAGPQRGRPGHRSAAGSLRL